VTDRSSSFFSLSAAQQAANSTCYPTANSNEFYSLKFTTVDGTKTISLSQFKGKVVLIANVASFCGLTLPSYSGLQALTQQYPELVIIGFPCGQFDNQQPELNGTQILNTLKYVRPGGGFVPNFILAEKTNVNGNPLLIHPVYKYLRSACPQPSTYIMTDRTLISWDYVSPLDLVWNFEKFVIDQTGKPFKRYSPWVFPPMLVDDLNKLYGK